MLRCPTMTNDTKWIVGTGVAVMASVIGSTVAIIAVVVTLVGGVRDDMDGMRDDMHAAVEGLRDDMHAAVEALRDDSREDHARFDARLDAIEVALGKVDQRLLTIERIVLPGPDAGE